MRSTLEILKLAAASKNDQINSMANSVDIATTSKGPSSGIYTKTEIGKDQRRIPADMNKVAAAISPRTGLSMFSKSSKQSSGIKQLGGTKVKNPTITDNNMQQQLDSHQYSNSLEKKDSAKQGFFGSSESRRTPGLASELKA